MTKDYFHNIYGCWLGKNIGGSIGCPIEGKKDFMSLPYKYPEEIFANDDIDLQLVWLDILKKKGIKITTDDLADGWIRNIDYPFDEYGVAKANLSLGLKPPITGIYNNWFCNCMGASIRSEIWACINPGRPEVAGWYAYQDASVDHWNEGVYGEVFLSVLESITFVEKDIEKAINKAIEFLPETSNVYNVVKLTQLLEKEGRSLKEIREKIIEKFGHHNFTDCVQNIGFIVLGLLKGQGNFLKTIIESVNCGYDTDCTGATAGAIIGIIVGKEEIIKQVKTKIDERIIAGWGIKGIKVPENINELSNEIVEIEEKAIQEKGLPMIEKPFKLPEIESYAKPLKIPFQISEEFSLNGIDEIEKKILDGKYKNYKEVIFDEFYFPLKNYFKNNGQVCIFLKTKIKNKEKRKIKLFPSSNDGIKMWVDKKLVLSHHYHNDFLPAPHRPGSPLIEFELDKGVYEILIEVLKCRDDLEFAWIIGDGKNHLVVDMEYERHIF
ncbi:MAG TPA: ADP-ribosylglycohydrolase family protein [bacterium]|nr:ADP-ribosylglycohydrolase family protein [bacterium]